MADPFFPDGSNSSQKLGDEHTEQRFFTDAVSLYFHGESMKYHEVKRFELRPHSQAPGLVWHSSWESKNKIRSLPVRQDNQVHMKFLLVSIVPTISLYKAWLHSVIFVAVVNRSNKHRHLMGTFFDAKANAMMFAQVKCDQSGALSAKMKLVMDEFRGVDGQYLFDETTSRIAGGSLNIRAKVCAIRDVIKDWDDAVPAAPASEHATEARPTVSRSPQNPSSEGEDESEFKEGEASAWGLQPISTKDREKDVILTRDRSRERDPIRVHKDKPAGSREFDKHRDPILTRDSISDVRDVRDVTNPREPIVVRDRAAGWSKGDRYREGGASQSAFRNRHDWDRSREREGGDRERARERETFTTTPRDTT